MVFQYTDKLCCCVEGMQQSRLGSNKDWVSTVDRACENIAEVRLVHTRRARKHTVMWRYHEFQKSCKLFSLELIICYRIVGDKKNSIAVEYRVNPAHTECLHGLH
ncbi:hypothetical protein N7G274_001604 [Stereocaulon virgatum]|uniref:Uncharacterized protein n=1 Tax=Stereocaulon virgatum TaxID=373712 RepID=A0ABR4AN62_9LECA